MGIKIPTITISTLTLLAGVFTPSIAWADETEQTEWTYAEMAAINAEIESELNANCGPNDPMCRDMYLGMNKADEIYYGALIQYRMHGFAITAVNPSLRTIKVAYDADMISAGRGSFLLKDLYIAQREPDHYEENFVAAVDQNRTESLEHSLVIFAQKSTDDTNAWFPQGTEMELYIPDLAMSAPFTGTTSAEGYQLQLEAFYRMAPIYDSWTDYFDLVDCLTSPGYQEGMECQIRYGYGYSRYIPVAVELPAERNANSISTTDAELLMENSASGYDETTPTAVASSSSATSAGVEETSTKIPTAPNTGVATREECDNNPDEFPWWTIILPFVAAFFIFSWWFLLPLFKHSNEKNG